VPIPRANAALLALALVGCWPDPPPGSRGAITLFVVLDTVRADHLSACGHPWQTTPTLDRLVAEGAALSCTAVAPGAWTLPSHASYFTGLEAPVHGAHSVSQEPPEAGAEGARPLGPARPLPPDLPVLAEAMPAVLVSGNPLLAASSGLDRGFRATRIAQHFGDLNGDALVDAVEDMLSDEVRDGDLLVVNIADAHAPWTDVPDGHPHLAHRKGLTWRQSKPRGLWYRFMKGERPRGLLPRVRDLYAHAVERADRTLNGVLRAVEAAGFSRTRLVLTSDHGELLGEHDLLGHGHYLHDENQVVPLLVLPGTLPSGPINAMSAHELVLGQPLRAHPVRAAAWPHARKAALLEDAFFAETSARTWGPDAWWTSAEALPDGALGAWAEAVSRSGQGDGDPALGRKLEALGYQ
jgi:hypothetical protein